MSVFSVHLRVLVVCICSVSAPFCEESVCVPVVPCYWGSYSVRVVWNYLEGCPSMFVSPVGFRVLVVCPATPPIAISIRCFPPPG